MENNITLDYLNVTIMDIVLVLNGNFLSKINNENKKFNYKQFILDLKENTKEGTIVIIEQLDVDLDKYFYSFTSEVDLKNDIEKMVKLEPCFKDYLWGGTKIKEIYNKKSEFDKIAESWELSAHSAGQSRISSGAFAGLFFGEYINKYSRELLGWKCKYIDDFPLLIKYIDAQDNLSIQVHPNDEFALKYEDECGKNEMWFVVEAKQGAGLYIGFNKDVSEEEVKKRIDDNTITEVLNFFPTKKGDVFFIPTGTVHAIGEGNLILEVQQSSNSTYRLYDFDRRDSFGNARELHIEKALQVIDYKKYEKEVSHDDIEGCSRLLSQCKYFKVIYYNIVEAEKIQLNKSTFYSLVCISGQGKIQIENQEMQIKAGDSIFIPAMDEKIIVHGKLSFILSSV